MLALTSVAIAQPPPDPTGVPPPGGAMAPAERTGPRFGGRLSVNSATVTGDDAEGLDRRTGFGIGGFVLMPVGPNIYIDAGLAYSMKGAAISEGGLDATVAVDYISAPVVGVYTIPVSPTMNIRVLAGGHISFLIAADLKADGESTSIKDDTNSIDFGIIGGAGIETNVGNGKLVFDLRLELGLSTIDSSDAEGDVKNQVISANAGYAF